jgi:hypothetical protein
LSTNYKNTLITASPDSTAAQGTVPAKSGSVAGMQHALLQAKPYEFTSDDLLFEVHARRNNIAEADRAAERAAFFAKSQACLRASPLVKQFGWGLHHDENNRVAAFGVESVEYQTFLSRSDLKVVLGMRSRRA